MGESEVYLPRFLDVYAIKHALFWFIVVLALYHGSRKVYYGPTSCEVMLTEGRLERDGLWQPQGCMMHHYKKKDAINCMEYKTYWGEHTHITFIGDDRLRQLYYDFIGIFIREEIEPSDHGKNANNLFFRQENLNLVVEFIWLPLLNDSMYTVYNPIIKQPVEDRPLLIVAGSALWYFRESPDMKNVHSHYQEDLGRFLGIADQLRSVEILWAPSDFVALIEDSDHAREKELLDQLNQIASNLLSKSHITFWQSLQQISLARNEQLENVVHVSAEHSVSAQMLVNKLCNPSVRPPDGHCCMHPEPVTTIQTITAVVLASSFMMSVGLLVWEKLYNTKTAADSSTEPSQNAVSECIHATGKLAVIMFYFYIADRENLFMKENKHYTHPAFFLPLLGLLALGLYCSSQSSSMEKLPVGILQRDQTDEWKGWMQLLILLYHITGASKVIPIYFHIRVLVASYLFLTGFGHFCYFYIKGDFGLHRFIQILFRMNFLVVMLCFVMNRPYQFYYFVPLVSFWFVVVYITMAAWPHVTLSMTDARYISYFFLMVKFVVVLLAIQVLSQSKGIFERIFLTPPFRALFLTPDQSIHEWNFRWNLDRYSTVWGMMFGLALMTSHRQQLTELILTSGWKCRTMIGLVVGSGLLVFEMFTMTCHSKPECNEIHPFISIIPILSYIFLRNCCKYLYTRYSWLYAWVGKISLELFIAQYHIWMAADTHGVFVLLPGFPLTNIIVTTIIFVVVSREIHLITAVLATHLVPEDTKLLLRNLSVFVAVLVPIGISHGVFGI